MFPFILFFIFMEITSQITPNLMGYWAYSDALVTNDEIVIFYKKKYTDEEGEKGGITKYKFDITKISEDIDIEEFSTIEENIKIYNLYNEYFIILLRRSIKIIQNYEVIKSIDPSPYNYFRDLCIISGSKFLVLIPQHTTGNIVYRLFDLNIESNFDDENPTYKTFTSTKQYKNFKCEKFYLSNNNYIFCLMTYESTDEIDLLYYNIFDDSLNEIVSEKELSEYTSQEGYIQYILMVKFSDGIIISLLAKYNENDEDCEIDYICNSILISFQIVNNGGSINIIKKHEINFNIYTGSQQIYLEKLSDKRIAVVYPNDYDLMKYIIKLISYIDNVFNELKEFSIESTNEYNIDSIRIFNINSEIAITYCQEDWEEEDQEGFTYYLYLTVPKCQDFEINAYINTVENIDFGKYILNNGLMEPETKSYKIKIESTNLDIYYNEENIQINTLYLYDKITFNAGNSEGNFETIYSVYNGNGYGEGSSCKINFNIKEREEEGQISKEIINKINELKLNLKENAINNEIYESDKYKIYLTTTSVKSKQKSNDNLSIASLDLKSCEKALKEIYSIPEEEDLIIIEVNLERDDTKSLQVEYEIYSYSLIKLDLNKCINDKIIVTIPYNLDKI